MNIVGELQATYRRHASGLSHLGEDEVLPLERQQIDVAFNAVQETLQIEMEHLRKLHRTGRWATLAGLTLMFIGVVLALTLKTEIGVITGTTGILVQVLPLLVFNQIEKTRASLRALLPDYRNLFSLVAISQLGDEAFKRVTREASAKSGDASPSVKEVGEVPKDSA